MHIAYLTSHYPFPGAKSVGGIGTSIKALAEEISLHGHEVSIFVYGQAADTSYDENGIHFHLIKNRKLKGLSWWLTRKKIQQRIIKAHRSSAIDILESPDWEGMTSFIKLPFPVVLKLNGSDTYFCNLDGRKVKWRNKFHEKRAFEKAEAIISVSAFTGHETNKVFGLQRNFSVIPNSVNIEKFFPKENRVDEQSILYFGGIIRKKGVLEIPSYFNKVIRQFPQAKLIIAGADMPDIKTGNPSTWEMMKALFDTAAIQNVSYLGSIPHESIAREIEKAAVCIFPSFAEALPVSWLEAMAMGKAVVASDVGWSPEIIDDGIDGFMANPKDANAFSDKIMRLLGDKALVSAIEKKARTRMETVFSTKKIAGETISAYQKIVHDA